MSNLSKLFLLVSVMIGVQACSGPSARTPAASSLSSNEIAAAPVGSSSELKGELVPAVVGAPPDPGSERTYRIGPHDLLKIEIFQVPELSSEERVNEDGNVVMSLIGSVKVGGLTPDEAEQLIANKLGQDHLQNPQVDIFVAEYASQKVTVTGNVNKPGVFPVAGRTTLLEAIALAGGFDEVANKDEVVVFRRQPAGGVNAYVVDVDAIEEGKLADPVIAADDRIVVPKSGMAVLSRGFGRILQGWVIRAPIY
jgi:polysaccharide export outer membrane protein